MLAGDDDLIVGVDETKLSGAADFAVIPSLHAVLMNQAAAHEMTLRFLQHGYFTTAEARRRKRSLAN